MRIANRVNFQLDTDAAASAPKVRMKVPNRALFYLDNQAGFKGFLAQRTTNTATFNLDNHASMSISTLRRTMLGRRPEITLSVWSDKGLVPLDGAIVRRGDLHHIQVDVVGTKLYHFVLATFMLKHNLATSNNSAAIWLNNQPTRGGIELVSTTDTIDRYGAAQQSTYQIGVDSLDTAKFRSRTLLHYEFQLDDTLGEVYSVQGSLTVVPDVFRPY